MLLGGTKRCWGMIRDRAVAGRCAMRILVLSIITLLEVSTAHAMELIAVQPELERIEITTLGDAYEGREVVPRKQSTAKRKLTTSKIRKETVKQILVTLHS